MAKYNSEQHHTNAFRYYICSLALFLACQMEEPTYSAY